MKVTLVRPPVLMPTFNMATMIVPPLGVAYVAAALRHEGHEVGILDSVGLAIERFTAHERGCLHGLPLGEVVERIPDDSGAIGVSIQFSYEWPVGRELLRRIRARFPHALLVAGGEHVTALPESCFAEGLVDVAVLGEGEATACALLETFATQGRSGLAKVPGICYRDAGGSMRKGTLPSRIRDLKSIARPAWDLVPMEEYLSRGYGFGVTRGRSIPVLASRGCPYQCTFCSNPFMWTTRWMARDPEDLLDEIAWLKDTYRAENFDFYDLTMIVKRQWILDFCDAIERRKMNFLWQLPSGTRSEAVDEEVSRRLSRTGCRNLSYAPESGSMDSLQKIKKKVSLPKMLASMRGAVKSDLNVKLNFIFGFPHEGWRHIYESFVLMTKAAILGVHDISIWVFVPYPGSELFLQLRELGKIPELDDEYYYRLASYADITQTFSYCERLSKRALLFARVVGIFWFYGISWLVRPWRPIQMLGHAITGHLESRSEMALQGMVRRVRRMLGRKKQSAAPVAPRETAPLEKQAV
ncbi:MAG: B12-binding domain-containing radical SAM protein [Planctomycetes bacterium]|nr:B12-binding domain-containing radical SAM protein [Planctomycetota bacterium]